MPATPLSHIEAQLAWYDTRATRHRLAFLTAKIVEIVTAAAIPIVALSLTEPFIIATLGALIAVVAAFEQLFRFQETWINYRQTAEALRNEIFLYNTGAGPYERLAGDPAADRLIANRVADLLTQENTRWQALAKRASALGDPSSRTGE